MSNNTVVWKNYDATGRDLHVDVPLSQAILNYRTEGLVGESVFPVIPVRKQSNMIPEIPLGEFLRNETAYRAPGTEANQVKFSVGTMSYFCKNYALKFPLTIEDRENADEVWQVRQNGAYLISDLLRIQKELRVFNTVNSTSNVATAYLPKSAWNAAANANNPLTDILTVINNTHDNCGYRPNNILFGLAAWRTFYTHSAINALVFPHGGGLASTVQAAQLFQVDNVSIARGYYNSAVEGAAVTMSKYFDDRVLVWYNPPGAQLGPLPRWSATFRWTIPGIPNMAVEVLPYDQSRKTEFVEVGVYDDEKVLNTRFAATMIGVNSAQSNGI